MKNKVYIGIDPGLSGGLAVFDGMDMLAFNMPQTYPDIYLKLQEIQRHYPNEELVAILEDVGHGLPGQSSKATATFARHNGHLEMALYALGIKTVKATPQKWQKHYSNQLGKSSEHEKKVWKNRLKGLAQSMFPGANVTLYTADAILLAYYGRKEEL